MTMPLNPVEREFSPELDKLAAELAEHIKTEQDLTALSRHLLKRTVESALQAELDEHLGYERHAAEGRGSGNSRNGYSSKTLKGELGEVSIQTPRDRNSSFQPQLIVKGQTRLQRLDQQILAFYAKGMTTRDIADTLREVYGAEVSPTLVAKVTDAVWETVQAWQGRPLDTIYPILYLDGLVIKVHHENRVLNKTLYVALGVNLAGHKDVYVQSRWALQHLVVTFGSIHDFCSETGGLRSTSVTQLHHYYTPIRHPQQPTPPLTGRRCPAAGRAPPRTSLVARSILLRHACCHHYPGGRGRLRITLTSAPPPAFLVVMASRHPRRHFEACSVFTHVAARMRPLASYEAFSRSASAHSLPPGPPLVLPAGARVGRVGLSPTDRLCLARHTQ
jgi:hypothetical protein